MLAEAYHLRGEIFHQYVQNPDLLGFASVSDQLEASRESFGNAIQLLEALPESQGTMDISRNLARAYGYRGDLYLSIGDFNRAWEDYDRSLKKRQAVAKALGNHVESSFQLARGYGNFGMLTRDFGSHISKDLVSGGKPKNPDESIESLIADGYVSEALRIQEAFKGIGDRRFRDDLARTSNVAAELYLFAAEHDGLTEDKKSLYLAKAEELADSVIRMIAGRDPKEFLASAEILRPDWPFDRRMIAFSVMLKLRIGLAREDAEPPVKPETVRALIPLAKGFASHTEDELMIYLIASLAEERGTHIKDIKEELARRRFNKMDRLTKHLRGLGMKPELINDFLDSLTGRTNA